MTFGRRSPEPFDSAEGAQIQRDIVGAVVHDLASITSALGLRADVAIGGLGERDVQAVAALTEQLRAATRPLVWLRGSPGRGALSPVRTIQMDVWWQHISQVAHALLPHGTRITLASDAPLATDNAFPGEDLSVFAMLLLATCRHFVDGDPAMPICLNVWLPRATDECPTVTLELTPINGASLGPLVKRPTRWKRFCLRTAARAGLTLSWWESVEGPMPVWRWRVMRDPATR